jgi:hypothetical protein
MNVWWLELQFEQEVKSNIRFNTAYDPIHIVEADVERKMDNGIAVMKHAARKAAETGNVSLDEALRKVDDMFGLAREETEEQRKVREIRESIYIYKGQDVKNDEDQKKMIDKRIQMYEDLQNKKQQRQLSSAIRKAKQEGNEELHTQLLEEYNVKYGRKNSSRSNS